MPEKRMIVVGAGIAGLATGCYARMNGWSVQLFELHDKPGGLCTSWKRRGYTFDGCIHWLVGSGPGSSMHGIWQELGALPGPEIVDHEVFHVVERDGGPPHTVWCDIDRYEAHLLELSPADAPLIRRYAGWVRRLQAMGDAPAGAGLGARVAALWSKARGAPAMARTMFIPVDRFAARFQDPFLQARFGHVFQDMPDFPMLGMAMTHAWLSNRTSGFPVGGSLAFARRIADRLAALGGEVAYKARVERILVEGDRAVGVRLADGTEHRADVVVSAADAHATVFELLEGRYADAAVRRRFEELPLFPALIQVSLGVRRDLRDVPHSLEFPLPEPLEYPGGRLEGQLSFRHYAYDPTLAPEGATVIVVLLPARLEAWDALRADRPRYDAEKAEVARKVVAALERRLPGLAAQVEVTDVATPSTFVRYTHNWQGSFEGWLLTRKTMRMRIPDTLPGLGAFHMVGQWVQPGGGLPTAALGGRNLVRKLCTAEGRPFRVGTPAETSER